MFDSLSDKLKKTLKNLRGQGKLTPEHVDAALREIRMALLEADVNYKVAKDFVESIRAKAEGQDVWQDLKPHEQVVKIVYDELTELMGGTSSRLVFTRQTPNVVMIVGLQGSGKTTSTGKISRWLADNQERKPLLVSTDVYRPAAREQLKVVGNAVNVAVYEAKESNDPMTIVQGAVRHAVEYGFDTLMIDTAGRLHIDDDLMVELERIKAETKPIEVLFVADAMTGQDAVRSAEVFHERVGITGGQDVAAVAHPDHFAVVTQTPAFAGIIERANWLKGLQIVNKGGLFLPGDLNQPIIHQRQPFSEIGRFDIGLL